MRPPLRTVPSPAIWMGREHGDYDCEQLVSAGLVRRRDGPAVYVERTALVDLLSGYGPV